MGLDRLYGHGVLAIGDQLNGTISDRLVAGGEDEEKHGQRHRSGGDQCHRPGVSIGRRPDGADDDCRHDHALASRALADIDRARQGVLGAEQQTSGPVGADAF